MLKKEERVEWVAVNVLLHIYRNVLGQKFVTIFTRKRFPAADSSYSEFTATGGQLIQRVVVR